MQIQDIIELMKHMNRNGISLMEYESEGQRLRLEKPVSPAAQSGGTGQPGGRQAVESQSDGIQADVTVKEPEPIACTEGQLITAPVVGVYYAAPSPENDPYVAVGSSVEAGETVCIIEAMKLMNEVTSSCAGEVLEIFVHDGQRVEYGQPLMRIGGA
ncbi:MAG: acetyl-CoA carboxylase biotin carboxyl carrier protein [Bacillota bacterium]|nr:acetyl-CoA carboxylase biotin carboxyl carrier protein [Bacillota bacterium]